MITFDNAFPLATIRLYPVPDQNYTLFIQSEKELAQFTLDQVVSLPAGWERALIYNLAIELAPEYGQEVNQAVFSIAMNAKMLIMRTINRIRGMKRVAPMNNGFDIRTRGQ
jgi:hypothetical protein